MSSRSGEHSTGEYGHVAEWAGKWGGVVLRIAGLIHLVNQAGTPEPWREPISETAMEAATDIVNKFVIPHGLAAHDAMGAHPARGALNVILAWVRANRLAEFSRRELHKARTAHVKEPDDWDAPLKLGMDEGFFRPKPEPEERKGRRPGPAYLVHPAVLNGAKEVTP